MAVECGLDNDCWTGLTWESDRWGHLYMGGINGEHAIGGGAQYDNIMSIMYHFNYSQISTFLYTGVSKK